MAKSKEDGDEQAAVGDVGDRAVAIMAARRGKLLPGAAQVAHVGDAGDAAAALMAARRGKTLPGNKLVWIDAANGKRLLVSPELKRVMEAGPLSGESQTDYAQRMAAYFPNVRTAKVGHA